MSLCPVLSGREDRQKLTVTAGGNWPRGAHQTSWLILITHNCISTSASKWIISTSLPIQLSTIAWLGTCSCVEEVLVCCETGGWPGLLKCVVEVKSHYSCVPILFLLEAAERKICFCSLLSCRELVFPELFLNGSFFLYLVSLTAMAVTAFLQLPQGIQKHRTVALLELFQPKVFRCKGKSLEAGCKIRALPAPQREVNCFSWASLHQPEHFQGSETLQNGRQNFLNS